MSPVVDASSWTTPDKVTAFTAVAALVVSLWPRIMRLLRGRSLEIVVADAVMLTHTMGNVHVTAFLSLVNTGGVSLTLARLKCTLAHVDGPVQDLAAQAYISRDVAVLQGQQAPEYPVAWVCLASGEQWSQTVRFYELWPEDVDQRSSEISEAIRVDIENKLAAVPSPEAPVEAEESLVSAAVAFFEDRFDLGSGEYSLSVSASLPDGTVVASREYRLSLRDDQLGALRGATREYRYGWGVCYPYSGKLGVTWVRLREASAGGDASSVR